MAVVAPDRPVQAAAAEVPQERPERSGVDRLFLGRDDPAWVRPALYAILALAGLLYMWALGRNGTGNDYYAATVLSGTRDWKAAIFGSIDASNFITVDKPPLFLWPSVLAARAFGFSSWTVLGPQAVFGAATIGLLYATMRRSFGYTAALLGAAIAAVTPVAVAVNRWNIPDTLLVLLLVGSAATTLTAIRTGRLRWLLVAAALVGLGFNVKMLQAWIVVPALALAYLVSAPRTPWRRIGHLALAGVVLVAVSSVWILVTDVFVPAGSRPYIGGSENDTSLDLVLGYNGLSRVFGRDAPDGQAGAAGPGGGANPFDEGPAWNRMFNAEVGDQVSWLLPLAVLAGIAGLALTWRRGRRDPRFAGFVLWLAWLVLHWFVFSFSSGIFHPYYVVQLVPAVAALAGAGLVELWRRQRDSAVAAAVLALVAAASVIWCVVLLGRTPQWQPWLRPVILVLGIAGIGGWLVWRFAGRRRGAVGVATLVAALVALLLGPAAYATTPLTFATRDPAAGPPEAQTQGPGGGGPPGAPAGQDDRGGPPPDMAAGQRGGAAAAEGSVHEGLVAYLMAEHRDETWIVAAPGSMTAAPIILATGGESVMTMGGFGGGDPAPTADELAAYVDGGEVRFVLVREGPSGGPGGGGRAPDGGPPGRSSPGQGPTGRAPGSGRAPGLGPAQGSGPGTAGPGGAGPGTGGPGGRGSSERDAWVRDNCTRVDPATYGGASTGATLYDCAAP